MYDDCIFLKRWRFSSFSLNSTFCMKKLANLGKTPSWIIRWLGRNGGCRGGGGWGEDIVAGAGVTAVQAAGFVAVGQGKDTSWQWEAEGEIQKKMVRKCAVYKFSILEFHKERGLGKEKQKNITIRENMSRNMLVSLLRRFLKNN